MDSMNNIKTNATALKFLSSQGVRWEETMGRVLKDLLSVEKKLTRKTLTISAKIEDLLGVREEYRERYFEHSSYYMSSGDYRHLEECAKARKQLEVEFEVEKMKLVGVQINIESIAAILNISL